MKNRIGFGMFYIIMGALLALGPKYIFVGCEFKMDKPMKCWWSTQAIVGIGILFIVAGICYMIIKSQEIKIGISIMNILVGALAIAIPKFLIGGCKKMTMPCLTLEFPSIYVIACALIIISIINILYLNKAIKGCK